MLGLFLTVQLETHRRRVSDRMLVTTGTLTEALVNISLAPGQTIVGVTTQANDRFCDAID